jgi:non-ribosomal peptide synthetase component E (peptide arylation enzyme)
VTVTAVVPPLAQPWCAATEWEPADLRSLRLLQVDGSKLARSHARQVRPALGTQLQQVFGTPDGFYRSGDRVRRLDTGHLVVTGRIKDVVNRDGENVAADELEEHLVAHPAIAQATVIGVPDEALGERICAVLVVRGTAPTLAEVKAFLTSRGLAAYKTPDLVRTAPSLPVTAVGKIDKRAVLASIQTPTPRGSAEY